MGLIALKLLLLMVYAFLYQAGGRALTPLGKSVRRWIGGSVMVFGLIGLSYIGGTLDVKRFLYIPVFYVFATLGYGGETFARKFLRRFIYGLGFGTYGLVLGFICNNLSLGVASLSLSLLASLYLGLSNPVEASQEETLVGLLSVVFLPFMVS